MLLALDYLSSQGNHQESVDPAKTCLICDMALADFLDDF